MSGKEDQVARVGGVNSTVSGATNPTVFGATDSSVSGATNPSVFGATDSSVSIKQFMSLSPYMLSYKC